MEDHILQLKKQCRCSTQRRSSTAPSTSRRKRWANLFSNCKRWSNLSSTKEWMTQKGMFALESLYLMGHGIHRALQDLVTKMAKILEEMGVLALVESDVGMVALVESDKSVVKVNLLLECTQMQWEEIIWVLKA